MNAVDYDKLMAALEDALSQTRRYEIAVAECEDEDSDYCLKMDEAAQRGYKEWQRLMDLEMAHPQNPANQAKGAGVFRCFHASMWSSCCM